jgi:zinc protease
VGDFDEAKTAALLKDLFSGWTPKVPYERVPNEHRDIAPANRTVATPDKENAVFLARQNVAMRDDDPDYHALYVANYILGGGAGFDSRLASRIRQKDGLSYGVGSNLSVPSLDPLATWSVYAISAPTNTQKVEAAMREEVERALKEGFTEAEVASAKSGIIEAGVQGRAQDAGLAGRWVSYLYLGRTFTSFSKDFEDKVRALTPAQVNAALRKHLDPSKISVVKAGDFSKK